MRRSKRTSALALLVLMAMTVSACGLLDSDIDQARGRRIDVAVPEDQVLCEYGAGGEDGFGLQAGSPILPGSATFVRSYSNRIMVAGPLTNRFYEISQKLPGEAGPESRDAGAATFIRVLDKDGIPVHVEAKLHFVFNAEQFCNWFATHGTRNSSVPGTYFSDDGSGNSIELGRYDMGFNVRNRIVSPWLTVLNEQFGQVLDDVVNEIVDDYGWEAMVFNKDIAVQDASGATVNRPIYDVIEERATERFSDQLDLEYGDAESDRRFYCGPGHNQSNPDNCNDIRVQVLRITAEDATLVEQITQLATEKEADRIELEQRRQEQLQIAALQAIDEENADARDASIALLERLSEQRIREAQIQAAEDAAIEAAQLEAENSVGGVNELRYQQALLDAQVRVAACSAAQVTGLDCVYLIAVLSGIDLPASLGGTFVVPQSGIG